MTTNHDSLIVMDDLLTVKQAAIILKVHHLTIRRYLKEGKIVALKMGGNIRIRLDDLRSFSQVYNPEDRNTKPLPTNTSTNPFSVADPLFRLRGRGLSVDKF